MLYLNHAGTSWPKPAPVQAAAAAAWAQSALDWPEVFEHQHRMVAAAFGITDPARLLLTPGCTSALQVGLTCHAWRPGDRVVTSAFEHHALHRPILDLETRGVEHVVVPPAGDAPFDLDRFERVLEGGRVRLVAFSAATNVTGALLPISEIVRRAHSYGAKVLVDAAQLAGWVELNVTTLGVDLLAFAGHKGPQAPWGVGGLYVSAEMRMAAPRLDSPAPMPGYCDVGSVDRSALAGLEAGLTWLSTPERADRLARARAIIREVAHGAAGRPGMTPLGPKDEAARVPTLAFRMHEHSAAAVARRLRARGIVVSGGHQCAPMAHRTLGTTDGGVVRMSVGPTTPDDAASRFLRALCEATD